MRIKAALKRSCPSCIVTTGLPYSDGSRVLLTFDDGPHPEITPKVLEVLDEGGAKAIFFLVGERAAKYPQLTRDIVSRGHIVANHTYTHPNKGKLRFAEYKLEIERANTLIESHVGIRPRLFRPPRGQLTLAAVSAAKTNGLKTVLWSNGAGEWNHMKDRRSDEISEKLRYTLSARDIVLLHDDNPKVPSVLSDLIRFLGKENYDCSIPKELGW